MRVGVLGNISSKSDRAIEPNEMRLVQHLNPVAHPNQVTTYLCLYSRNVSKGVRSYRNTDRRKSHSSYDGKRENSSDTTEISQLGLKLSPCLKVWDDFCRFLDDRVDERFRVVLESRG